MTTEKLPSVYFNFLLCKMQTIRHFIGLLGELNQCVCVKHLEECLAQGKDHVQLLFIVIVKCMCALQPSTRLDAWAASVLPCAGDRVPPLSMHSQKETDSFHPGWCSRPYFLPGLSAHPCQSQPTGTPKSCGLHARDTELNALGPSPQGISMLLECQCWALDDLV